MRSRKLQPNQANKKNESPQFKSQNPPSFDHDRQTQSTIRTLLWMEAIMEGKKNLKEITIHADWSRHTGQPAATWRIRRGRTIAGFKIYARSQVHSNLQEQKNYIRVLCLMKDRGVRGPRRSPKNIKHRILFSRFSSLFQQRNNGVVADGEDTTRWSWSIAGQTGPRSSSMSR